MLLLYICLNRGGAWSASGSGKGLQVCIGLGLGDSWGVKLSGWVLLAYVGVDRDGVDRERSQGVNLSGRELLE